MEKIKALLGEDWNSFNTSIRKYLVSDIDLLNGINESLLSNSGKQLRPLLVLLVARACAGVANEDTLRYAVSVELLHNATLFHDDVADKSDKRRGRPTLRAMMGPESSVLVGDFWLVCALKAIMDSDRGRDRCLKIFSQTLADLAEGEMFQLQKAASCATGMEDYLKIIYCKTASLFVASAQAAAISVGASQQMEEAVMDYARYVGSAFQMRDDIFDYAGGDKVGKPLGVDILERKITLPLLCAMQNSTPAEQSRIRQMIKDDPKENLQTIMDFVGKNGGVRDAQKVLNDYVDKAILALKALPGSEEKELLIKLARYIALRNE